jgi:hypothetical protein
MNFRKKTLAHFGLILGQMVPALALAEPVPAAVNCSDSLGKLRRIEVQSFYDGHLAKDDVTYQYTVKPWQETSQTLTFAAQDLNIKFTQHAVVKGQKSLRNAQNFVVGFLEISRKDGAPLYENEEMGIGAARLEVMCDGPLSATGSNM